MSGTPPDLSKLSIDRSTPARSGGRAGWVVAILVLLGAAGYVAWREGWLDPVLGATDARPVVEVAPVTPRRSVPARTGTSANGYVVARRRAALSTEIQGRIVELLVEEGDRVAAGDVVARLDTRQLEASLAQGLADISQARATARLGEVEYERFDNLVQTGDANVSERDRAEATRDEALARVASLEARVEEIEVLIENSSVRAPFSGVITAKNAEVGEVVSAIGATGPNARGAVATLVDFDTLEVQVELAQTSLAAAQVGAPVTIYLDAFPRDGYLGRVRQIWPTANRTKATVEVRAEFLERDDRILPEMGVRIVFLDEQPEVAAGEGSEPAVYVPVSAVRIEGDEWSVFLLADGRAVRRVIQPAGDPVGGQVPVASGLAGSERIIVSAPPDLADGDEVQLEEEP